MVRPFRVRCSGALVVILAVACGPLAAAASAGVQGGVDTKLPTPAANPLSSPTAIVPILNTGRALILEKGGAVRVLNADGTMVTDDALDLTVCTDSEEGLLGAAVDPGFATNGFVYLYYSRPDGTPSACASSAHRFNRVSRFKMTGDTIDLASELVLLDKMNIPAGNHNAGDLHIGNDGDLYVSVGDGGTNPRGSGPSAAQDLSLLNGKILRITTTGGVPAGNPLVGVVGAQSCALIGIGAPTTAKCTEIYDYGLRNPFRFAMDPNTTATRFFINDTGQSTWEEVDLGGSGLNYGWDIREGFCVTGSSSNCGSTPAQFTDPLTAYNHSTGCTFLTAGTFIPNGVWASQYDDGYLFADGGCGDIFLRTSAGTVDYASPFAQTTGTIVDMAFITEAGQTALYYVTNSASELHRITLPAGTGPATPTGPTTTTPTTTTPTTTPATTPAPVAGTGAKLPKFHRKTVRCTIVAARGLLAGTARTRVTAHHCRAHQVVVALRHGRPIVTRHHGLVPARRPTRPRRSAGHNRVWTLRVVRVSQKIGTSHPKGSRETLAVAWVPTPSRIAGRRTAHFL